MPAHSLDALFRSLNKGETASVYYFHGPEDVLKDDAVGVILDRVLDPGLRDFNFDQRSAGQIDAEAVHALCNTVPMLAERRVVLIREVEAWKRKTGGRVEFLRYLQRPSPDTVVILVQGAGEENEDKELARGAYAVRFDPLPAERAAKWVMRRAGQLGLDLEPDAAEHLVRSVGPDLGPLASELAKLAALPPAEPLTVEQVGELVGVRQGETLWDWRSAVLGDQGGRAVALLPAMLAQPGITGVKLVTLLGTALIGVGVTRRLYDKGLRGRALEDAVFKALLKNRPAGLLGYKEEAARWSGWAPRWPTARIRSALRAALETDQALKSTTISDERGLVTDLVLRIGMDGKDGKVGKDGKGKQVTRRVGGNLSAFARILVALTALPVLPVFPVVPAFSQTDPRLIEVIRYAQEGQGDSARIKVRRLLASTSPADTLYPQIIYTQAMVASDAADMRRQLQRVAVEYSSSNWADDALLRLVQLDYASGNLDGAARNVERIRQDYPGSALLPQAAYWAARTYFDRKNPDLACRWIADGIAASQGNIELQNQLGYLNQRCSGMAVAGPRPSNDSVPTVARTVPDTAKPPGPRVDTIRLPPTRGDTTTPSVSRPDTTRHPKAPSPSPPPTRPDSTWAELKPAPTPPPTAAAPLQPVAGARFRIQITAVRTAAAAESIAKKLKAQGLQAVTVEERGLYKVRVGSYTSKAEAAAAVPGIKAKVGGSPFVVAES